MWGVVLPLPKVRPSSLGLEEATSSSWPRHASGRKGVSGYLGGGLGWALSWASPTQINPGLNVGLPGEGSRARLEFHFSAQLRCGVTGLGAAWRFKGGLGLRGRSLADKSSLSWKKCVQAVPPPVCFGFLPPLCPSPYTVWGSLWTHWAWC